MVELALGYHTFLPESRPLLSTFVSLWPDVGNNFQKEIFYFSLWFQRVLVHHNREGMVEFLALGAFGRGCSRHSC